MNIKMKLKYLLTISLAIFLSACNHQNNSVPIQSDSGGYTDEYQSKPSLTNTEALAIGATGVATGYATFEYAENGGVVYSGYLDAEILNDEAEYSEYHKTYQYRPESTEVYTDVEMDVS